VGQLGYDGHDLVGGSVVEGEGRFHIFYTGHNPHLRARGEPEQAVMHAVSGHPGDRPAFERQRPADRQEVFKPFGRLEGAMRQQAMVAHADPQAEGNPIEGEGRQEGWPGKEERSGQRSQMEEGECDSGPPVDAISLHNWYRFESSFCVQTGAQLRP